MSIVATVTAAFLTMAAAQPAAPRCPADEGPALAAPWGLTVCERPARVPVVMYDEPQPGVRALAVTAGGVLARAGLAPGDVIYQVAGTRVTTGKDVVAAIGDPATAHGLTVSFWRSGKPYLVRVWTGQP
jgi:S1-C subfamily serine protease